MPNRRSLNVSSISVDSINNQEIPSLSISGYTKVQENVADIVHATKWDEMKKASEEEKKMALECGQCGDKDVDSTPVITVVADGQ